MKPCLVLQFAVPVKNLLNYIMVVLFIILSCSFSFSQIELFGLDEKVANSLVIVDNISSGKVLLAGTESGGIYIYSFDETEPNWSHHYFNRTISSLYVQETGVGPGIINKIFASVIPDSSDSTLIYTTDWPVQSYWSPNDSGLDKRINKLAGFNFSGHEPPKPVFATDGDSIIYKFNNIIWEKSWVGPKFTRIKALFSNGSTIWAGGIINSIVATLILLKSTTYGEDWQIIHPPFGEIFSCHSIVTPPEDTNTVYAGLNGMIIKSTDGGENWLPPLLNIPDAIFNNLAINPSLHDHIFAGGKTIENAFILFESKNGGTDWQQIDPMIDCDCIIKGINSMIGTMIDKKFTLFMGTDGNGVIKYTDIVTSVNNIYKEIPGQITLEQNYPNPFNPSTNIRYEIPQDSKVELAIYNLIGEKAAELVNKFQASGRYQIEWNAENFVTGVYIYRLKVENYILSKKLVLLK